MTTATVLPINRRQGVLRDTRNKGYGFKAGNSKPSPAIPADAEATLITVNMATADTFVLTVAEWSNPDYIICETETDISGFAAALAGSVAYLKAERIYFGTISCYLDGEKTFGRPVRVAVQRIETGTADRHLVTVSSYDTEAMVWVAAVDTDDVEG